MRNAGHGDNAERFYLRALEMGKEHLGHDHLKVVSKLFSLEVCVFALAQTKEAEEFNILELAILQEKLGSHHPDVGQVLGCAVGVGRVEQAEGLCRLAIAAINVILRSIGLCD